MRVRRRWRRRLRRAAAPITVVVAIVLVATASWAIGERGSGGNTTDLAREPAKAECIEGTSVTNVWCEQEASTRLTDGAAEPALNTAGTATTEPQSAQARDQDVSRANKNLWFLVGASVILGTFMLILGERRRNHLATQRTLDLRNQTATVASEPPVVSR